ncbi:hypothetical protein O3Q51_02390 [Cryomorphaceae bacterium 1068]|nr:hypothetical protein [Cryomorphaceae bacterium 1068]
MRRLLILILLLGFAKMTVGQRGYSFGPMAGLNFSKVSKGVEDVSGTARPFIGFYGQYHSTKFLSAELNAAYSMRGERFDQTTLRFESNFIDAHALLRIHFLNAFSFSSGIGYYYALSARAINRESTQSVFERDFEDVSSLTQMVVPLELGFQFHNEATLHFTYGIGLNGGFNNAAVTFRFPIRVTPTEQRPPSRRMVAMNQIRDLRRGALLVRLPTSQPLITALNERGATDKTQEVIRAVETENRAIVSAFKANYSFSEVYFFYSNYSEDIRNGNFSSLMNADFDNVSFVRGDSLPDFFIAEFANLKPDTARYYIDTRIEPDPNGGLRRVKRYGDSDIGADFRALVIKDHNFVQLCDPFPYYVRSFKKSYRETPEELIFLFPLLPFLNIDHAITVSKLNNKLRRFGNVE